MALAAPVVTQAPATPQGSATPQIPFRRASRKKNSLSFQTAVTPLGAAPVPLSPIQLPADGFLRYIDLEVTITAAGNAAAAAFAADGPFNVLSQVGVSNSAGSELIVPLTGYQVYLINKYGLVGLDAPYSDCRSWNDYLAVTGAGATGGSATFTLRVPAEIDPATGFCSIPNLAANRAYNLNIQLAASATVYGTAPTNAPTVQIRGKAYYWSQPYAQSPGGATQEQAPLGDGSVSVWRFEPIVVNAGDKILKSNNIGNVIREAIFVLRNGTGARDDADFPALSQILYNKDPIWDAVSPREWRRRMAQDFGYGMQPIGGAGGAVPAQDVAGGQDTGVYVWADMLSDTGHCRASAPRDQYLITADTTLLQYRGSSFGNGAATFEVLTNEIKPVSASALYAHV